jgi:ketosteroid isomerase-like protein
MTTNDSSWMKDYYAAWDSADADAIAEWFDADVVLEDVPTGHVASGVDQARSFVEGALERVPGATYEVKVGLVSDDTFAVEWVMHPYGLRGSSVGTLRAGKIASNRDYWNMLSKND